MTRSSLPWMLLALVPLCAFGAERPRVLVLKSAERAAYSQVVAGFSAEVNAEVTELTLEEDAAAGNRTLERAVALKPAMVLAIGPTATVGARRVMGNVPLVFTMVPYHEKYSLEGPNVTGIALTSDFSAELALLKSVFPAGKRVGLLHDPRFSGLVFEDTRPRAKELGLSLVPVEAESEAGVGRALFAARGKVDALLLVGDKTVATTVVVKRAILFAAEEKIPFITLSASQVKEGAMLSLSASPVGIGQQAGRLANRILHEKVDPGALAVAQPEGLELAVNLTTARKLGPGCDLAQRLLELAARRNHPLKVFE